MNWTHPIKNLFDSIGVDFRQNLAFCDQRGKPQNVLLPWSTSPPNYVLHLHTHTHTHTHTNTQKHTHTHTHTYTHLSTHTLTRAHMGNFVTTPTLNRNDHLAENLPPFHQFRVLRWKLKWLEASWWLSLEGFVQLSALLFVLSQCVLELKKSVYFRWKRASLRLFKHEPQTRWQQLTTLSIEIRDIIETPELLVWAHVPERVTVGLERHCTK